MAYRDFKDYIQQNYSELLLNEIQKFVEANHDGRGFHSFGVLSLLKQKIENLEVRSLTCHDDIAILPGSDHQKNRKIVLAHDKKMCYSTFMRRRVSQ